MHSDVDPLCSDLSMARRPWQVRSSYRYDRNCSDGGSAYILLATRAGHAAMDVWNRPGGTSNGGRAGKQLYCRLYGPVHRRDCPAAVFTTKAFRSEP